MIFTEPHDRPSPSGSTSFRRIAAIVCIALFGLAARLGATDTGPVPGTAPVPGRAPISGSATLPGTPALPGRTGFEAGVALAYCVNLFADGSPAAILAPGSTDRVWTTSRLKTPSGGGYFAFTHDSGPFGLIARFSADLDNKYGGFIADVAGGRSAMYFMLDEGGISISEGVFKARAGRLRHYDIVDTPYSLAVNSRGIAVPLASLAYDDGFFFYETRWIELNRGSVQDTPAWQKTSLWKGGFPDRGASIKTYGLRFPTREGGTLRFGYQDISVYTQRAFDAEYFLNPIPSNLTQYVKNMLGRPWADGNNDNTIMSFFADYQKPGAWSVLGQFLLDDAGLGYFVPGWSKNPWQMALSLGTRVETKAGSFGLYAAGATKYTFEANQTANDMSPAGDAYGYTYFPDSSYYDDTGDGSGRFYSPIATEDTMIGYMYGENNLAVKLDWKNPRTRPDGTAIGAGLEFRLSGTNSVTNVWHDALYQTDGTWWLDDPVLEKRFLFSLNAKKKFGAFTLGAVVDAGVALDAFRFSAPIKPAAVSDEEWNNPAHTVDRYSYMYRPTAGAVDPILRVKLGLSYALDLAAPGKSEK